jgi:hypothetical protein
VNAGQLNWRVRAGSTREWAGSRRQSGPVSWQHLVTYARTGCLAPDDLVHGPRSIVWQRAVDIPGLFYDAGPDVIPEATSFAQPPTAPPLPPLPAPPAPVVEPAPSERHRSGLLYWWIPAADSQADSLGEKTLAEATETVERWPASCLGHST